MKKLLFVLAFAFIGQQAFSQMYIVTMSMVSNTHPSCNNYYVMTTVDPQGNITYDCMGGNRNVSDGAQNLVDINLNRSLIGCKSIRFHNVLFCLSFSSNHGDRRPRPTYHYGGAATMSFRLNESH